MRAARLLFAMVLFGCNGTIGVTPEGDAGPRRDGALEEDATLPCGEGGAAIAFFERRCAGCHQGSRTYPDLTRGGLPLLEGMMSRRHPEERMLVPGDPEASWLYRKMAHTQGADGGPGMPLGRDSPVEELPQIESWIRAGAPATCDELPPAEIPYDPNALDPAELFSCSDPTEPRSSVARIRRIDDREFDAAALGRAGENPLAPPAGTPYSTYAEGVSVDPATLRLLMPQFPSASRAWTVADPQQVGSTRMRGVYRTPIVGCITANAEPTDECIDRYVETLFLRGAGFRSPSPGEFDRLRAFLVETIALEEAEPFDEDERVDTLELVTQAARLSTASLFRPELGDSSEARRRLTDDEIALALGRMLWVEPVGVPIHADPSGTISPEDPDVDDLDAGRLGALRAAVEDGSIGDAETRLALFRQYAGGVVAQRRPDLGQRGNDNPARGEYWLATNLLQFFREWFGYTQANTSFKADAAATSGFEEDDWGPSFGELRSSENGTEGTLEHQLDDLIARIVIETDGGSGDVFAELMTTTLYHLPSNLGTGSTTPCSSTADCTGDQSCPNTGFCSGSTSRKHVWKQAVFGIRENVGLAREDRWVEMDPTRRMGVLTHPAWLAAHGANFEDDASMVQRGNWIRAKIFCQSFGTLDDVQGLVAMLPAQPEETAMHRSARDRVYLATESPETEGSAECFGCHQYMNSLGAPFELFNHAGFERESDHGAPPDGSTVVDNLPDPALNGTYATPFEFVQAIASSNYARRGFVRHAFRFFMGRDEVLADGCTLVEMETALGSTGSYFAMLEALVRSETFVYRHDPALGDDR